MGKRVIRKQRERGGNRCLLIFFISFLSVSFYFLISLRSFSGLSETKPACVSLPSSFSHLLLHLLPFPLANKRWRLMNSVLMHASATVIALALGTPPTVTKCFHHQDGHWTICQASVCGNNVVFLYCIFVYSVRIGCD